MTAVKKKLQFKKTANEKKIIKRQSNGQTSGQQFKLSVNFSFHTRVVNAILLSLINSIISDFNDLNLLHYKHFL